MSVPATEALPAGRPPAGILEQAYPKTARPVFFGHYWLTGTPQLQSANALCLDYSAGKDGPLVAYLFDEPTTPINLKNLAVA